MIKKNIPRLVISGLRGGSGKTILSLSLTASLRKNGLAVTPFKKGPDYIDAGWLAKAAGSPCYNLDLFMMTGEQAMTSFALHSQKTDIAVIEGNRGLFDGMDHKGTFSTAELAKLMCAPVVIVVDCTKTSHTIAAMVLGCQQMDPALQVGGVVLNRVATSRQEGVIRRSVEERCEVPVLGAIPRLRKDPFPERHMGLTPFQEHQGTDDAIRAVEEIGREYLDMDRIIDLARGAGEIPNIDVDSIERNVSVSACAEHESPLRIGVIRDSAFQFYYEENFEALKNEGADIVEVSPLSEQALPDIDALYIGGGFPETHAIQLAQNEAFRDALLRAIEAGMPVYAECGGLMYLGKELVIEGRTYPMTGALPVSFGLQKRPLAHGYTIVEVENENPFFQKGVVLKGHEFHYSRVLDIGPGSASMAFKVKRGRGIVDNMDGMCYKNVLASYTHLHANGSPQWVEGMIRCAMKFRRAE